MSNPLPKQVIVGRRGFIYYIGPLLDDDQFCGLVTAHIKDTSFGIDNARHYKALAHPAPTNKFEINSLFRFWPASPGRSNSASSVFLASPG